MATDIFLALKDRGNFKIRGESKDDLYTFWIELLSFDIDTEVDTTQMLRQLSSVKNRAKAFGQLLASRMGGGPQITADSSAEEDERLKVFTFKISKYVDRASPFLFVNYCQSASKEPDKIPTALVAIRKSGLGTKGLRVQGVSYLRYQFSNCYVSEYSIDHDSGMNTPKETIKFCCSSYYMSYVPQTAEGEKDAPRVRELGWDFEKNEAASPHS